jgi:hypothetical protein
VELPAPPVNPHLIACRQSRLDLGRGAGWVFVLVIAAGIAAAAVLVPPKAQNDHWLWLRLLLAFGPLVLFGLLANFGPKRRPSGMLGRLWARPWTVTIDEQGLAWTGPKGQQGRADWSQVSVLEHLPMRSTCTAAVRDVKGAVIVYLPETVVLVDDPRASYRLFDLVVQTRPDRYQRRKGGLLDSNGCVLRKGLSRSSTHLGV